jgi:hypothetical protein
MEIQERMAKAETEIAVVKESQQALQATVERGLSQLQAFQAATERAFSEQREATAELRMAMERNFAEERAARERAFRWTFSAMLSMLALLLGVIAKLAGAF